MSRILLTHSPEALAAYYGERALAGLRALGEVKLHRGNAPLEGEALIAAAADCALVVSYVPKGAVNAEHWARKALL